MIENEVSKAREAFSGAWVEIRLKGFKYAVALILILIAGHGAWFLAFRKAGNESAEYRRAKIDLEARVKASDEREAAWRVKTSGLMAEISDIRKKREQDEKRLLDIESRYSASNWAAEARRSVERTGIPVTVIE